MPALNFSGSCTSIRIALVVTGVKVMRFKAAKGETLHFRASGPDAAVALAAILSLVEGGFAIDGETISSPPNA